MTAPLPGPPAIIRAPVGADLAATRQDRTEWWSGCWIAEDIASIRAGVSSGQWIDTAIGGFAATMDTLGFCTDPLGSLVAWGAAWLIEHVRPLSQALDWLAGDPDEVLAHAATWRHVAQVVNAASGRLAEANGSVGRVWQGPAASAYRSRSSNELAHLSALGEAASALAAVVEACGLLVAMVRMLVRDLLATFVSVLSARMWEWVAEAAATLGLATPAVVAQVSALVAQWAPRIGRLLVALIRSLARLRPEIELLERLIRGIRDADAGPRAVLRESGAASPTTRPDRTATGGVWSRYGDRDLGRSDQNSGRSLPLGFGGAADFDAFAEVLYRHLDTAYPGTAAAFQGSSVTGHSFVGGHVFDDGRVSDFDIALGGDTIFQAAREQGIPLRSHGTRTAPLTAGDLDRLGLHDLAVALSGSAGRTVNFMIYRSIDDAVRRSASIEVPRPE
jgi:uncharacterized protein YukE